MPLVHALLTQLNLEISDMDDYYVCEGPGSFTGVRIGIATVKGFAQPFGKPVHGFSSMFLIASGVKHFEGVIVPLIDAKRGDVYYGVYEWNGDVLSTNEEGVEPLEQLLPYLEEKYPGQSILLLGDALKSYPDAYGNGLNFILGTTYESVPKASNLVMTSMSKSPDASAYTIKANYMRKSQAERDR
jgi:tRNA threonylcarbamoyladenosine biosynthesis protein TsaB